MIRPDIETVRDLRSRAQVAAEKACGCADQRAIGRAGFPTGRGFFLSETFVVEGVADPVTVAAVDADLQGMIVFAEGLVIVAESELKRSGVLLRTLPASAKTRIGAFSSAGSALWRAVDARGILALVLERMEAPSPDVPS